MYQQIRDMFGNVSTSNVQRVADGAVIPFDELNPDYLDYLEWIAAGNVVSNSI